MCPVYFRYTWFCLRLGALRIGSSGQRSRLVRLVNGFGSGQTRSKMVQLGLTQCISARLSLTRFDLVHFGLTRSNSVN
ncbi:hypothetical protein HanPI659440_Chr08g0310811 [Helianthus annuus]|nr:hypothetical protein HanPI659440_Chr08g0310811 [Helianthus annuus]